MNFRNYPVNPPPYCYHMINPKYPTILNHSLMMSQEHKIPVPALESIINGSRREKGNRQLSSGQYNSKCGRNCLTSIFNQAHRPSLPSTNLLCTLPCPSKVQFFLWKILTEGLPTFDSNISLDAILDRRPLFTLCSIVSLCFIVFLF